MDTFLQLPEEKRFRVINAALDEFANKGYRAASTNEIAGRASISKGSLFGYFGTKEKLYQWLLGYATRILEDALFQSRSIDSADFIESLTRSAMVKLAVYHAHPSLKGFLYKAYEEQDAAGPFLQEILKGSLERYQEEVSSRVDISRFRSDLTLDEAIRIANWVLDGMARDHLEAGLPLDETSEEKLVPEMLGILKKLLYKEEYL